MGHKAPGEIFMYTSIAGVYRDGRVELRERPHHIKQDAPVIVTFLDEEGVDLRAQGVDEEQAAELRGRLAPFAEDWDSPEMSIYDNYDAAKSAR